MRTILQGFPIKFETMVGERGITLSGGQKQRTAISRAVIRDPKILILDDALSSVDTYTEEQILHELKDVMRGRTSILISHRVSTVKEADEIIVLDNGEIVERGTHDELAGTRRILRGTASAAVAGRGTEPRMSDAIVRRQSNHAEEEVLGKAYDSRLMRRLITYLRPYKTAVAAAFVLILWSRRWKSRSPG